MNDAMVTGGFSDARLNDPRGLASAIDQYKFDQAQNRDLIFASHQYMQIAGGDPSAGLLLWDIVFWHLNDKEGKSKLRIFRDDNSWMARSEKSWWDICAVSPRRAKRAIKALSESQSYTTGPMAGYSRPALIEKKVWRWGNTPTSHLRLIWKNFLKALQTHRIWLDEKMGSEALEAGQSESTESALSESTQRVQSESTQRVQSGKYATRTILNQSLTESTGQRIKQQQQSKRRKDSAVVVSIM